eukprot:9482106-Pyramimonas_sp.AAC.1
MPLGTEIFSTTSEALFLFNRGSGNFRDTLAGTPIFRIVPVLSFCPASSTYPDCYLAAPVWLASAPALQENAVGNRCSRNRENTT